MISFSCPWCGHAMPAPKEGEHACVHCGRRCCDAGNLRRWIDDERPAHQRDLATLLLRQFSPLSSRLSPLRYFADWRVEQYYRRTLADQSLAEQWASDYLEGLTLAPHAVVLDHGCGRGRHSALLSRLGYQVAAQDITSHSWWRHLPACTFQTVSAEAERLPWNEHTFALVVDVGVIHYLTEAQLSKLAGEVLRVLQPGGFWLLLEGNSESYGASRMRSIIGRLHEVDTVRRLASAAGFQELDLSYEGFYAPLIPLYVNFVRKLMRPGPMDLNDHRSVLAARLPSRRRAHWRLRLTKPRP
jgi:SAM-dependent methyltransferase